MVDVQSEFRLVSVLQSEAVLGLAAVDDLRGDLGDGVGVAAHVGAHTLGLITRQRERGALDIAGLRLPHGEIVDVDVLSALGESSSAKDGGNGGESELHLEGLRIFGLGEAVRVDGDVLVRGLWRCDVLCCSVLIRDE